MASPVDKARHVLELNHANAQETVRDAGMKETLKLLRQAERELEKRLHTATHLRGLGDDTFTVTQLRASIVQIKHVIMALTHGLKRILLKSGKRIARTSTKHAIDYLIAADAAFRGVGTAPLALREALMFERARVGVHSSILHRLSANPHHPSHMGILKRYGVETIKDFERTLRVGMMQKKSWHEMRHDITKKSPFLRRKPAHWAARIVRTEMMGAYNRAHLETVHVANHELGDMVKIVSSVFDDRTGADSYAVHGQIRYPDEEFESWFGGYDCPPDRPNDRSIIVAHRKSWGIPGYLEQRDDGEIAEIWASEGRKGPPPDRPEMDTTGMTDD